MKRKFHNQSLHQVKAQVGRLPMDFTTNLNFFFPVIFIAAYNTTMGTGWKGTACMKETTEKHFFECVKKSAYLADDFLVFKDNDKNGFKPVRMHKNDRIVELFAAASKQSINVKLFYIDNVTGIATILRVDSGVISKNYLSTLNLNLNNTMSYLIMMYDPKIAIITVMYGIVPKLFLKLDEGAGLMYLNIKVR